MEALKPRLQHQSSLFSLSQSSQTSPFKSTEPHFHCLGLLSLNLTLLLYTHSEQLAPLQSLRGQPKVWRESFCAFQEDDKTQRFPCQVKFILSPCDYRSYFSALFKKKNMM